MATVSKAKVIMLAVRLVSDRNLPSLQNLICAHPKTLHPALVLRLLLSALPESTEPSSYTTFLQQLVTHSFPESQDFGIEPDWATVEELSEKEARHRVRGLRLLPLTCSPALLEQTTDPLTLFLIHRAHRIDSQTGVLTLLPQLIVPFISRSNHLRTWFISTLLPLLRYDYEYYPERGGATALWEFEQLRGSSGVEFLLSRVGTQSSGKTIDNGSIGRDLKGLVGPWMFRSRASNSGAYGAPSDDTNSTGQHGREHGRSWQEVFEWLVFTASERFSLVVDAVAQWDGPADVDLGGYDDGAGQVMDPTSARHLEMQFLQASLAAIYTTPGDSIETLAGAHRILTRVTSLLHHDPPPDLASSASLLHPAQSPRSVLDNASTKSLLPNALLRPSNLMTTPDDSALAFLQSVLLSAFLLVQLGHKISIQNTALLCLSASVNEQRSELQRLIYSVSTRTNMDDKDWLRTHQELVWLWRWGADKESESQGVGGIFRHVTRRDLERDFLKILLINTRYGLATSIYLKKAASEPILGPEEVEKAALEAAMSFYDNASNCNRTRGGMKKASDTIDAFFPGQFPQSKPLQRAKKLLAATHRLSFYSLTLQRGKPFQPVNIRAHQDPILLLSKVLEQNSRSYTKLDDLLEIGRNLVEAGLMNPRQDGRLVEVPKQELNGLMRQAEQRITGMAIEAALAEDDFETAYSYVLNHVSKQSSEPDTDVSSAEQRAEDGLSWRAAFQAGRFRPTKPLTRSSGTFSNPKQADIRCQEMRMDLLSQALLLAPPAALPEILGIWRRCEEELNVLVKQEADEEEQWDDQGDQKVPGQFISSSPATSRRDGGRLAAGEEAPVGLFDVARGAAAALSKNAFPLRRGGGTGAVAGTSVREPRPLSGTSAEGSDSGSFVGSEEARVRKRDMVSNMVTGGLASGIGWVLGATPTQNPEGE